MSFDVFLISFRDGKNSLANAAAARTVLAQHKYDHDPEFDSYRIDFSDGSCLEMYAGGLDGGSGEFDGGMIALRGSSEPIGDFIFDFSRAAGCVIFPAMEPACVLIPREDLVAHMPPEVAEDREQIFVASGGEVLAALSGGYAAWRVYRDRVVRQPGQVSEQ